MLRCIGLEPGKDLMLLSSSKTPPWRLFSSAPPSAFSAHPAFLPIKYEERFWRQRVDQRKVWFPPLPLRPLFEKGAFLYDDNTAGRKHRQRLTGCKMSSADAFSSNTVWFQPGSPSSSAAWHSFSRVRILRTVPHQTIDNRMIIVFAVFVFSAVYIPTPFLRSFPF